MTISVGALDHVAFPVRDMEAMVGFYQRVLGARCDRAPHRVDGKAAVWQIAVGEAMLSVHQIGNGISLVAAAPGAGGLDVCFRWNAPIETAVEHLRAQGVEIIVGPVARRNAAGETGRSVYFRDPDGNLMEFLSTVASEPRDGRGAGHAGP